VGCNLSRRPLVVARVDDVAGVADEDTVHGAR
jgi:hypothetical protein